MHRSTIASRLLTLLVMIAVIGEARAQEAGDAAAAQALFEDGRQLMDQGRYDEACPKLEESQRLDPGGGTLLNLALCYEKQGRTATAWQKFKEALGAARRDGRADRASFAQEHITAIEPKLSRLKVDVPPKSRVAGLEIRRDEAALRDATWGTALPVDPGEHTISARAPGHESWQTKVTVAPDGDQKTVSVPSLVALPAPPAGSTPPPQPQGAPFPEPDKGTDVQRISGFVIGGVGIVAIAVGAVFGGLAISKDNDADALCEDPAQCVCDGETCTGPQAPRAAELSEDARLDAKLANGFVFGGVGLIAIGLTVVLTSPTGITGESALLPEITPNAARLTFRTRF